jgi:hypothetical protein
MTPQDQDDAKVRADLAKIALLVDLQLPFGWGFVVLELGRLRQRVAELERHLANLGIGEA